MAGFFESLFPGALGAYGYNEMLGNLEGQQDALPGQIGAIRDDVNASTNFTPWSVRSGQGNIQAGPDGMQFDLNSRGQGIQDSMFSQGQDLLGRASQDQTGREQDIYDRMRAAQQPEEQRQLSQMQNLANAQGRGGLRGEQYGGTPEQLAYAKAVEESKNSAMLGAMGQAQNEAQSQYTMGSGMMDQGYNPMNQLMQQGDRGLNNTQLGQGYATNRANLLAQLGLGEMGTATNLSNIQQNAFGNMVGAMGGMAGGLGGGLDGWLAGADGSGQGGVGGLWNQISSLWGGS
jgi:hypothetical protein